MVYEALYHPDKLLSLRLLSIVGRRHAVCAFFFQRSFVRMSVGRYAHDNPSQWHHLNEVDSSNTLSGGCLYWKICRTVWFHRGQSDHTHKFILTDSRCMNVYLYRSRSVLKPVPPKRSAQNFLLSSVLHAWAGTDRRILGWTIFCDESDTVALLLSGRTHILRRSLCKASMLVLSCHWFGSIYISNGSSRILKNWSMIPFLLMHVASTSSMGQLAAMLASKSTGVLVLHVADSFLSVRGTSRQRQRQCNDHGAMLFVFLH